MLNAIGSLVLAAVVFTQWGKESRVEATLSKLRVEAAVSRNLAESETKRAANLERDIVVLKQSLEATQRAALEAADSLGQRDDAAIRAELAAAREQVEKWKTSIADRDAQFRDLNADLVRTRRRLDEAIVNLKAAGVR